MWRRLRRRSEARTGDAEAARRGREARRLGRRGERMAAKALRRAGYRVLGRNLRTPWGEVDLLALDGPTVVLVEVKTAGSPRGAPPNRRVSWAQRLRLSAAARWLRRTPGLAGRAVRHDLVAVTFDGRRGVATIRRHLRVPRRLPPA